MESIKTKNIDQIRKETKEEILRLEKEIKSAHQLLHFLDPKFSSQKKRKYKKRKKQVKSKKNITDISRKKGIEITI